MTRELFEAYRAHHAAGRQSAVAGPERPRRRFPWWMVGTLILGVGVLIGNRVVPYDDRRPVVEVPAHVEPARSFCSSPEAQRDIPGLLDNAYPVCP